MTDVTERIEHKPTIDNVLHVYRAARDSHKAAGFTWYGDAHQFARSLDSGNVSRAAGVIAALSPQTSWQLNMILSNRAFMEGFASGHTGDNEKKANDILAGWSPSIVLGGDKVRNFYMNILEPTGNHFVTIDRHAHDIAIGEPFGNAYRPLLRKKGGYDSLADIYREASKWLGILPSQLQATTWLVWREALGHWE